MYDLNVKSKFIHFKAKGLTIKKISELMGINRTTLIQWNKELYIDIKIAERDEFEQMFEQHFCPKDIRVQLLAEELGACYIKLANKEERADNLTLLKEIEKLTKLLNMETDDRKYYSMLQKASAKVNKNFPVIINDEDKFREYDETYNYDNENPHNEYPEKIYTKEQNEKCRKIEEDYQTEIAEALEQAGIQAEEDLQKEVKESSAAIPKAEIKHSRRILNIKPDMKVVKNKKGKRRSKQTAEM